MICCRMGLGTPFTLGMKRGPRVRVAGEAGYQELHGTFPYQRAEMKSALLAMATNLQTAADGTIAEKLSSRDEISSRA